MKRRRTFSDVTLDQQVALFLILIVCLCVSTSQADCPIRCNCSANGLVLVRANLTVLPVNISDPETITCLNLAGNNLTQIQAKDFQIFTHIETLDLSQNAISSVEDGSFRHLRSLQILDLSKNNLTSLPENSFSGLVNLTKLVLSENFFVELKKSINGAVGLKSLSLSLNSITVVTADTFDGSNALERIDLSGNKIRDFPTEALQKLPNLHNLTLSKNRIIRLVDCSVGPLAALTLLQIQDNAIVDIAQHAFSPNCQKQTNESSQNFSEKVTTSALQTLDLAQNELTTLSAETMSPLVNLQLLNLNGNKFKTIDNGTFQNLSNLVVISLSFLPELRDVANASFVNLTLYSLYIHHCPELTFLTPSIFKNVTGLQNLVINQNGFHTISRDLFTWDENLSINANDNPFNCDCRLQWIPEVFQNEATSNVTKTNLETLRCITPVHLRDVQIKNLKVKDLRCKSKMKSTHARFQTAAVAGALCAVIGILIIVFVKFRNRICIFVKRQFRYKAHKDNRELFSVKLSEIIGDNEPDPFYEDSNLDLRLQSLVDTEVR